MPVNTRGFCAHSTLKREVMTLVSEGYSTTTTDTAHQPGKRKNPLRC